MPRIRFAAGNFLGKDNQSGARWLKKIKYELQKRAGEDEVPPKEFLQTVDFLLVEDAEYLIEIHREASYLLSINEPTQKDADRFTVLFEKRFQRFPATPKDTSPRGFMTELKELKQEPDETITKYYERVVDMMVQVDVRDRPMSPTDEELTFLEELMLDNILEAFTRGFRDPYITKKTIKALGDPNKSIRGIYNLADTLASLFRSSLPVQRPFLPTPFVPPVQPSSSIESLYIESAPPVNIPNTLSVLPVTLLALPSEIIKSADYINTTTPTTIEPEVLEVPVLIDQTNEEILHNKSPKLVAEICVQNVESLTICPTLPSLPGLSTSPVPSTGGSIAFLPTFGILALFVLLLVQFSQAPIRSKCALHASGFVRSGEG